MAFKERERRDATGAPHSSRSLPVYFIAAVASIGGLLFGYDTGVISGALLFLRQSFGLNATLLVSITFLSLIETLGAPATFWLFAFFGVLAFIFSWILVPETKGRSLEQIERYWENGRHWGKAA